MGSTPPSAAAPSSAPSAAAPSSAARAASAACGHARGELEELADALARLEEPELERQLSNVADALALAEDAPSDGLDRALGAALGALSAALRDLQSSPRPELESTTAGVAKTMARLYPARKALETALSAPAPAPARGDEEPAALPLVHAKRKPKKAAEPKPAKKRAVLELVPDAESGTMPVPSAAIDAARRERERRDRSRVALDVDIGLHSETNFFAGFGDDISEGGLFVATYDLLPVGTQLSLSFVVPLGPQVNVRGRVAWIREAVTMNSELHPGMGVEFEDLDADGARAIQAFLHRRAPIFYEG